MRVLAGLLGVIVVGCGPAPLTRPTWGGTTPHLTIAGSVNSEKIDISMADAVAVDTAQLWCVREYEVPLVNGALDYSQAKMVEIKVRTNARFTLDGGDRYAELELKKHDFQHDAIGAVTTIVPRSDVQLPGPKEMWFEWEWHAPDKTTLFEQAAVSGEFKLEEFTGTPDASGVVIPSGTGTVGGTLTAKWNEVDSIRMSFSVKCGNNVITQI